ncbi:hypothetical protein HNP52_004280 [Sphingomonas kyeonggiensis]|uniref:AAA domain-containing protein n=1 Tax=Sphingomonas kyeonggiensis TaxID=1268553 RepID=A0A7W7K5S5_9SPHN|nr:AAA-like domain-containing protein [Sphingomonas kyeonggiensis]MBB4841183.1 hypothetical protein [Sphingomonas kyeonggiensis]
MTHLHGPVPVDDDFYSERPFEGDLIGNVQAGRWVLLLGPRQHGKTSALIRLKRKLLDVGTRVASVDLQTLPPVTTYGELVAWFANRVAAEFGVSASIEAVDDVCEALAVAVPDGKAPIVILVDEASNIGNEDWRNSFYGQIRWIATASGDVPDDHVAKRLRFVFSGTFRVEKLVAEANSPFNTCEVLDTTDLSEADILTLVEKAEIANSESVAEHIFSQVGGQPFLVQRLIDDVSGAEDIETTLQGSLDQLRSGRPEHVRHLFRKILAEEALVRIVGQVVQEGSIPFAPGDDDQNYLIVLGVMKIEAHRLIFRNALYRHVASVSPQITLAPQVSGGAISVLFSIPSAAFAGMANVELREIAFSAQAGAVGSHHGGGNRLALAGYGTALEAFILDFLLAKSPAEIATAHAARIHGTNQSATDPSNWSLANLMRGARAVAQQNNLDIPENLREWRNLVHPKLALNNYKTDDQFVPEVVAASALLAMVLRDLV